jgi:hypothetical protein
MFSSNEPLSMEEELRFSSVDAYRKGDIKLASELLEQAIEHGGSVIHYHIELIDMYRAAGMLDDALRAGLRADKAFPENIRVAYALGFLFYDRNEIDKSIEQFERAITYEPDSAIAHTGLGVNLLARGDWERGWSEYEWRYRLPVYRDIIPEGKPRWKGELVKTLLLICGEGFGDTIQFMRYIPHAAGLCSKLIVLCKAESQHLIELVVDPTVIVNNWNDVPPFDAYCVLTSIVGVLYGEPPKAIIPHVRADKALVRMWAHELKKTRGYRVGLTWQGSTDHCNDFRRSISFYKFEPLFELLEVTWIGIQKGVEELPIVNYGPKLLDFNDTAALIANLDLVITIDSAVAHLAGAMGKPVWLLLPYASEWRWMRNRSNTHWYPTMRLFRQPHPGDWSAVISRVRDELIQILSQQEKKSLAFANT